MMYLRAYFIRTPVVKYLPLFLTILFSFPLFILLSCGKKGAPTLHSYEMPDAPTNLSIFRREDKIILGWNFPGSKEASIEGFTIMRKSDNGFIAIASVENSKRSFFDQNFQEGIAYEYKILARNHENIFSKDSNTVRFTPKQLPPPPGKISFQVNDNLISMTWDNGNKGLRYNVYKSFKKGLFDSKAINNQPLTGNAYQDQLSLRKPAYYVVRSLTSDDIISEGPQSEEITVDPFELVPSTPKDLRFFISPDSVLLQWEGPPESWITGFRVYRRTGEDGYVLLGETQIPSFLDHDKPVTKRDYRVSAVGLSREGLGTEIHGIIMHGMLDHNGR